MAIDIRRYIAGDAAFISPRSAIRHELDGMDPGITEGTVCPPGVAWTATIDLKPVACGGFAEIWPGRWQAWGWCGEIGGRDWCALSAMVRTRINELFQQSDCRRLETSTPADFGKGCRWLISLGFTFEHRAARYGPDGSDYALYVRLV